MINKNHALITLKKLGPFSPKTAQKKAGISATTLKRWVKAGILQKSGRGLYIHPESLEDPRMEDFSAACAHFGKDSAVGGLTALFYYGLIEQVPTQIWLIVPTGTKTKISKYRTIRTNTSFKEGIDKHDGFRITSIERTLIEGLKFQSKIGLRTVIGAIRRAIKEKKTNEVKIGKMATKLNMRSTLVKYWETFVE